MASISSLCFYLDALPPEDHSIVQVNAEGGSGASYSLFLPDGVVGLGAYRRSKGVGGTYWVSGKFTFALYLAYLRQKERQNGQHKR